MCATVGRENATDEYRTFVKELYHAALAQILSPLRPGLTTPHIMQCPDGHFRRAELGPFIADYPEQVCLSGIVYGWCPKYVLVTLLPQVHIMPNILSVNRCRAFPDELEKEGAPRFREHTEALLETFSSRELWDVFGVIEAVTVRSLLLLYATQLISPLLSHLRAISPVPIYTNS